MKKSKMNKFQYNERIYNYKHGLVNSAENQTVAHSGVEENEEHIEHALPGTPGSYNYNSNRAKGWEWDDHKYIRKEERADGTIKYIYADGSSRIEDTNKVLGKPMRTAATGGTPGGSYTPPIKKTPNSNPVDANAVNNSSYIPTQTNLGNGLKGTPGGSTYRKPVPGTPTGPLGNGVADSRPRDAFKANLKMGQGGTPTGLTGTYKESDPDAVRMTANVLTAQNYKKEADKKAAERALYQNGGNGYGATPNGVTGTYKPLTQQGLNQLQGKGTPGGATGPSTTAGKYSAKVWSDIKDAISQMGANKANAAAKGETDLTAIEAANPYMSKWTSSAYGLAHGLLGDYLRENYGSDPRFFDENGVAISGTDTNKILYTEDPNYRDLANRIFEAEMFGDIQPGENYYKDLLAAVGYPIPDEYSEEKNAEPAPQKNTMADFANAITDNGQITPQSEAPKTSIADFAMQIGANGPQNDLYDVYTKNSDPERRNYANYAMGYALGYIYGNIENAERAFPDWVAANGHLDLNDPNTFNDFCAYAYNYDPEIKEIADAIYAGIYKTKQIV